MLLDVVLLLCVAAHELGLFRYGTGDSATVALKTYRFNIVIVGNT